MMIEAGSMVEDFPLNYVAETGGVLFFARHLWTKFIECQSMLKERF